MVFIKNYLHKSRLKRQEYHKSILEIIGAVLNDSDFQRLKHHRHHLFFNRYEHLINASRVAFKLAKVFKADIKSCTLAGILHDFHHTQIKGHVHGILAAENASKKFDVNEKVQQLIKSHMYPFGRKKIERFKGRDFWIVKFADFYSMCFEILYSLIFLSFSGKNRIKLKNNKLLIESLSKEENVLFNQQAQVTDELLGNPSAS